MFGDVVSSRVDGLGVLNNSTKMVPSKNRIRLKETVLRQKYMTYRCCQCPMAEQGENLLRASVPKREVLNIKSQRGILRCLFF